LIEELAGVFVYLIAVVGGALFVVIVPILLASAAQHRRTQGARATLVVSSTIVIAFLVGGILSWNLIPFHWDMPFWTTLKASVDSEKYGHPVEHKAEGILIWVLFGSVSSAISAGAVTALAGKLRHRLRHA
jgi:hypothetical protein